MHIQVLLIVNIEKNEHYRNGPKLYSYYDPSILINSYEKGEEKRPH